MRIIFTWFFDFRREKCFVFYLNVGLIFSNGHVRLTENKTVVSSRVHHRTFEPDYLETALRSPIYTVAEMCALPAKSCRSIPSSVL